MDRRTFIALSTGGLVAACRTTRVAASSGAYLMTVTGQVDATDIGWMLPHEHLTTDFTGAEKVIQPQYRQEDAFNLILPYLLQLKKQGVHTLAECTPAYLGRDVVLLSALSKASGIHILTNTGYYAAVEEKFLPKHVYSSSDEQLADRWLQEWQQGIDNTGIKPGFIKLGVGKGPLTPTEHKLIRAAAITHLNSGLKIAIHSGDGAAAMEEHSILSAAGVAPEAHIVVHAQNDREGKALSLLAARGVWISLDGIKDSPASIPFYVETLLRMKQEKLLHRILLSHDDGWGVTKKADGSIALDLFGDKTAQPYAGISRRLKPELELKGFTKKEFRLLMKVNPAAAYSIKVCKR